MARHNNLTVADIQERIGRSSFHQLFRPEVLAVDNDAMTLELKVHMCPQFERQPGTGQWHGGVLASLVDIAGCYALMLVAGGQMLTLNFSTDFLRLAASDHLIARARVRRAGRPPFCLPSLFLSPPFSPAVKGTAFPCNRHHIVQD